MKEDSEFFDSEYLFPVIQQIKNILQISYKLPI
jgi:hypothetical protein